MTKTKWVNGQGLLTDALKPAYKVPSMAEIAETPWNGYNVVSTFSGCGGSSLGLKMAGFMVRWANEFVDAAADVYELNAPDTIVSRSDIREVTGHSIKMEVLTQHQDHIRDLDLLEGSPPCSVFSVCGKREAPEDWGYIRDYSENQQRVDDLFDEYIRLLGELQPKVFLAENVPGLSRGQAKPYLKQVMEAMMAKGYRLKVKVLDAQWLGVPQRRKRLIFIGTREDLNLDPALGFPNPVPHRYTVTDAFVDLENYVHPEADISRYAVGKEWNNLVFGEWSDVYFQLVRPHPLEPSPTVTQTGGVTSAAAVTNPWECRKFSIPELKRLCSFPDDFQLLGTYRQQYERLGRSVPPLMYKAVGEAIRDRLLRAL